MLDGSQHARKAFFHPAHRRVEDPGTARIQPVCWGEKTRDTVMEEKGTG